MMTSGGAFVGLLLWAAYAAVFLFALYFVVRAAVRDGIRQARRRGDGGLP